jgi:hypothetical protein
MAEPQTLATEPSTVLASIAKLGLFYVTFDDVG